MQQSQLQRQLAGWSLTTVEILYRMPDHLNLVQSFTWQKYDLPPHFPVLRDFLKFWHRSIEGPIVEVRMAHKKIVTAPTFQSVDHELLIN